ncbi:hypothetical protein [Hyphomicrobium sp.]|uniref:hypothetical protein n=1 Tax=Hyphomicrobium sp. TaxID=82 RepID=UPI001D5D55B6|nr:hypothetical protein [Hyphomicrobium sp.]MBY0559837.1 hypothetical protein [Hyphomicrobium sp.]
MRGQSKMILKLTAKRGRLGYDHALIAKATKKFAQPDGSYAKDDQRRAELWCEETIARRRAAGEIETATAAPVPKVVSLVTRTNDPSPAPTPVASSLRPVPVVSGGRVRVIYDFPNHAEAAAFMRRFG